MSTETASLPSLVVPPELELWNVPSKTWLQTNDKHWDGIASAALVFHTFPPSSASASPSAEGQTRLLLLQRAPHDSMPLRWEPPGGAVDPEDGSILAGCARELWEEAGLRAARVVRQVDREGGVFDVFTNRTGRRFFCRFSFEVEVEQTRRDGEGAAPGVTLDPEEHVDWYWASRDEIQRERREDGTELPITSPAAKEILLKGFDLRSK